MREALPPHEHLMFTAVNTCNPIIPAEKQDDPKSLTKQQLLGQKPLSKRGGAEGTL